MNHFIGIDVGTGSARAGVFDQKGSLLGTAAATIATKSPKPDFAQQSSAEIWSAICQAVQQAVKIAAVKIETICGIGFDATCSLVVADAHGKPVSVCPTGDISQDVILWMDHRAISDAEAITATGAAVLAHVGGQISPEMEMPKLRWLKRELPESWARATRFWDLPDWLVHRASGTEMRSLCSPVCKWTYLGHKGIQGEGWDQDFLRQIGLEDLLDNDFAAIGNDFGAAGTRAGTLTPQAAAEMGLIAGIAVATGLIDAYAGALGTLGVADRAGSSDLTGRLALIAGTSTCHICLTKDAVFVPGIWGPYYSVLLPQLWANEGGQSAAGALIDAVIARHCVSKTIAEQIPDRRIADVLDDHLAQMATETAKLTANRHVQPDFHGNRSPLAQPWRRGAITGLTLAHDIDDLALDYLATIQALAYGTRHILEELDRAGVKIDTLVVSGGLARNQLYLREHADVTGCRVLVPAQEEPVLLGSAMIGAVAAEAYADLPMAMAAMSGDGQTILPRGGEVSAYHNAKYQVYRKMQADYADYVSIMTAGIQD